jgi:hypothetical protein
LPLLAGVSACDSWHFVVVHAQSVGGAMNDLQN